MDVLFAGIRKSETAVAEIIENNVCKLIIDEQQRRGTTGFGLVPAMMTALSIWCTTFMSGCAIIWAMRYLLDIYICVEESEKVSAFDDMSLV